MKKFSERRKYIFGTFVLFQVNSKNITIMQCKTSRSEFEQRLKSKPLVRFVYIFVYVLVSPCLVAGCGCEKGVFSYYYIK